MMKTVKKTARSRSVTVCSRFFIMNGSPIKNRNGKMNGTGRSQCERDGRMNGNGSGLKKLPSNAGVDHRTAKPTTCCCLHFHFRGFDRLSLAATQNTETQKTDLLIH